MEHEFELSSHNDSLEEQPKYITLRIVVKLHRACELTYCRYGDERGGTRLSEAVPQSCRFSNANGHIPLFKQWFARGQLFNILRALCFISNLLQSRNTQRSLRYCASQASGTAKGKCQGTILGKIQHIGIVLPGLLLCHILYHCSDGYKQNLHTSLLQSRMR